MLRPLDIEARAIAQAANLPEDNVLYQAVQHFRALEVKRTWLAGSEALNGKRLSKFLDEVGLRHSFYKPHIAPARQALAHLAAELYDSGYFPSKALHLLSEIFVLYDPKFILKRPDRRPSWVGHIGGIPVNNHSFIRIPERWVESARDSLPLLYPRTSDGQIVIGEWTRLKYLDDKWPEEERISVVRAIGANNLWDGFDVESGHPPFAKWRGIQVADYLCLRAPLDHFVIAHNRYEFETPGACWLALNPELGRLLGWQPICGSWFCWANQAGDLVAKSVWWSNGPLHQWTEHLRIEVGSGWLVLVTEKGFEEITQRAGQLSRGGLVRQSLGYHSNTGRICVSGILPLP